VKTAQTFFLFTSILILGCGSSRVIHHSTYTHNTTPGDTISVWRLPPSTTGVIKPREPVSLTVSDGNLLVSLNVASSNADLEQKVTLTLRKQTNGYQLLLEPPLSLDRAASAFFMLRSPDTLYAFAESNGQYQPARCVVQGPSSTLWFKSAESIWIGSKFESMKIARALTIPKGIDCSTVLTLEDLACIKAFSDMPAALDNKAYQSDRLGGIARVAAEKINEILCDSPPEENCGYYLSSLLELSALVDMIGLVDATVDIGKFKARVEEVLEKCPLEYELMWHVDVVGPEQILVLQSREPWRGVLGTSHKTPHNLEGTASGGRMASSYPVTLNSALRIRSEFDLTDPFLPRTVMKEEGFDGVVTFWFPDSNGGPMDITGTFDDSTGLGTFGLGMHGAKPLMAGVGQIVGNELTVVGGIYPGLVVKATSTVDNRNQEPYSFELRHRSEVVIRRTDGSAISTTTATLIIPNLADVDDIIKTLCELAADR
jgi:hypothetical protein